MIVGYDDDDICKAVMDHDTWRTNAECVPTSPTAQGHTVLRNPCRVPARPVPWYFWLRVRAYIQNPRQVSEIAIVPASSSNWQSNEMTTGEAMS